MSREFKTGTLQGRAAIFKWKQG